MMRSTLFVGLGRAHFLQTTLSTTTRNNVPRGLLGSSSSQPFSTSTTSEPPLLRPHKSKSTVDLLNSYLVFQLCSVSPLVSATPTIISLAQRLKLSTPLYCGIKSTFFKHFCGGENLKEVAPTIESFKASGIGSILDLAMEADLDSAALSGKEAQSHASKITAMMKESIDIAATQSGNFIAVKVTAFVPPGALLRWSNTLTSLRIAFYRDCLSGGGKETLTDLEGLRRLGQTFPGLTESALKDLFAAADRNGDGKVDWIDVSSAVSLFDESLARALLRPTPEGTRHDFALVTEEDLSTATLVLTELSDLCSYARAKKVRIMMDAEQTYFQPAIDDVSLGLCRRFNEPLVNATNNTSPALKYALIYNTYQLYLKDAYDRLVADVERARRLGYAFGVKIVRGAYMISERDRASFLKIDDPINPDIQTTHANFNKAIDFLIKSVSSTSPTSSVNSNESPVQPLRFVVASHNKGSVELAVRLMKERQIDASEGTVAFAQLMGMQDGTTYGLAAQGIKAYKYIPYGPVEVAIPYLHRRAQENSSVLGGAGEDKRALWEEISRRFSSSSSSSSASPRT